VGLIDFYEIRDFQEQNQQNILNIYQVRNLGSGGPAANVAQTFIDWVLPVLTPIQSNSIARTVIEVQNLGSPFDFASVDSSSHPGTLVGSDLTTLIAATIQFNRTRTDIKNGMKRYACGSESKVAGNLWELSFLTDLQTLGDKIVDQWELAGTPGVKRLEMVIIKRFCSTTPSPPCAGVYRLPDITQDIDANFYAPVTATVRTTVRSQVSRKRLV